MSWEEVEDEDGRIYRWPDKDGGLQNILSSVILTMTAKPDSVFKDIGEDIINTHYEITARWKK